MLDGTKLGLYPQRVEAWLRGEKIAPITVDMALTRACNLSCVYCYGQLQGNEGKPITREVITRTFEDFAEIGVKGVSLVSDGESTCSPHLRHAIFQAYRSHLAVALGTNGVLLNKDSLNAFLPILSYLRFNISAGEKKRYNEIMRPGDPRAFDRVVANVQEAVRIRRRWKWGCTIGLQMVLMPQFADQVIPLCHLARDLGVDYLVIKHCSDDERGSLGVDYRKYRPLFEGLKAAEKLSNETTRIVVKWNKLQDGNLRDYTSCYGPPFHIQLSGSGLVAPCGMLFADQYRDFHIGNIVDTSFKEIWQSERYWDVMRRLASPDFNAKTMCGCLCLQHLTNKELNRFVKGERLTHPGDVQHKEFL